jgi:hypothetical protein
LSSNSVVADPDQVQASGAAEATQENEEEEGKFYFPAFFCLTDSDKRKLWVKKLRRD